MSTPVISKVLLGAMLCLFAGLMPAQEGSVKFGKEILDTAVEVQPVKRINTGGLEFAPVYYKSGILYVTAREASKKDLAEGNIFISLEYAPLNEEGLPIAPVPFAIDEKTENHKGPVTFSPDENTMYLSRSNMEGLGTDDEDEKMSMKIYSLSRGDTFWVDQKEMPFNVEGYTSFHPTISSDGNFMVFSSNREGGFGNYDLYGVERIDGHWSEAFNLGPEVNSNRDEAFPFLYEDKYLLFSSDRRGGEGKFDFYWSVSDGTQWTEAKNLGTPFNSSASEVGIAIDPNGKQGFFASDRKGGEGGDDIYAFFSSVHLFEDEEDLEPKPLFVSTLNEENEMRLSQTSIWMFPVDEQGMIIDRSAYKTRITEDIESKGLTLEVERKQAIELDPPDYVTDRNGQTKIILSPKTTYRLIAYKPGYVEFDTIISYKSADSLIKLPLAEASCLPLEVKALTSGKQPLTEIQVLVKNVLTKRKETYDLTETRSICINYNKPYEVIGIKEGYHSDTFLISPQSSHVDRVEVLFNLLPKDTASLVTIDMNDVEDPSGMEKGATIVLNNIYYDYNKSSIRVGAEEELDALASIMKEYPGMKIELSAHTDSRGAEDYNLRLSLRRAESAKEYLVSKGIDDDRIQAIGYGESRIRNRCEDGVECTEREHQYNRRTEVKIVELEKDVNIRFDNTLPTN